MLTEWGWLKEGVCLDSRNCMLWYSPAMVQSPATCCHIAAECPTSGCLGSISGCFYKLEKTERIDFISILGRWAPPNATPWFLKFFYSWRNPVIWSYHINCSFMPNDYDMRLVFRNALTSNNFRFLYNLTKWLHCCMVNCDKSQMLR